MMDITFLAVSIEDNGAAELGTTAKEKGASLCPGFVIL